MNDILFARLSHRSAIVDHNNDEVKYIFIIQSDVNHMTWSTNLYSLFQKIVSDNTLYNDLFQAVTKSDIIQSLADVAVRIQLPVYFLSFYK